MSSALRGAVVGYGFIAENGHIPAYLRRASAKGDFRIEALADTCEARRAAARRAMPGARVYSDHRSLLDAEASRLDFIDIATPPCDHAEIAHAALDRGLHVLCEKPLAASFHNARSMLDHAERARRVIMPCHNYRHAPVVKEVRRLIDSGCIGSVRLVTLDTFRNTHAKGVSDWRPDWRRERSVSGGGIAMDHGSHTFYLAFEWLGSYPSSVSAHMSTLGDWDTEDNFSCTLQFPSGIAVAQLTWTAGMRKVIYTVHGDRGAITVNDDDIELTTMKPANGSAAVKWETHRQSVSSDWMDASHVGWFSSLLDEFKESIETNDYVGHSALDALACIHVIRTAYSSARSGSGVLPLSSAPEQPRLVS